SITIFHILTHTSGLPPINDPSEAAKLHPFAVTPAQNIAKIHDKSLEFAPGSEFKYSNSGYILLGLLIEKVSGRSYQEFIQDNIFSPLGMNDSGYDSNSDIIPRRANGYAPGLKGVEHAPFIYMSLPFSAGALYSTTEDLLRWELGLFGGKLLSAESLNRMTTPFKEEYGFGLHLNTIQGRPRISHGGGIEGFNAYLAYYPDSEITVIVLANLNGNTYQRIGDQLAALAHGDSVTLPSVHREITVNPSILMKYAGTYMLRPDMNLIVTLENGRLYTQVKGQQKFPIYPESETIFFLKVADATYEFVKDDKGVVSGVVLRQGDREIRAPRISEKK
ncbi:MAG: serine hydrolase, partial [Acidobacteria bacterium]|nr:serine hydrolase [Acidobacteriota bacterium]